MSAWICEVGIQAPGKEEPTTAAAIAAFAGDNIAGVAGAGVRVHRGQALVTISDEVRLSLLVQSLPGCGQLGTLRSQLADRANLAGALQ